MTDEEHLVFFIARIKKFTEYVTRDTPDKILEGLYLGGRPSAENLQNLTGLGVKHILQISDKERGPPFP